MRAWRTVLDVAEACMNSSSKTADGKKDHQFDVIICIFLALRNLRRSKELEDMINHLGKLKTYGQMDD